MQKGPVAVGCLCRGTGQGLFWQQVSLPVLLKVRGSTCLYGWKSRQILRALVIDIACSGQQERSDF